MLQVFICEDNPAHKEQIEKCVIKSILIHELDMEIGLSTDNPETMIEYVKTKRPSGLYILDIHLNHKIDGLELASIIREYDPRGFVVFITTHDEALILTFQYKAEAMDFILKDEFYDLSDKIADCIINAHKKYISVATKMQRNFAFSVFDKVITVDCSKIYFFETSRQAPRKVLVHTREGMFEFYGKLNDIMKKLDEGFYRCHKSCIINTRQELRLDVKEKRVYFRQGISCAVSSRKMKLLIEILKNRDL